MERMIIAATWVLLLWPSSGASQVYKWVDENGRTVYSSTPPMDPNEATVMRLRALPPSSAGARTERTKPPAKPDSHPKAEEVTYNSLKIATPALEETIWSNTGDVKVSVALQPTLHKNHKIRVFVDGKPLAEWDTPEGTIGNLERGAHTLLAEVIDTSGGKIGTTNAVTFYIQQASARSPVRKR